MALSGLACPSAGNCVAVGTYRNASPSPVPVGVIQSKGAWRRAVRVPLPANATSEGGMLHGVACAPGGGCVAVGSYSVGPNLIHALVAAVKAGRFHATEITALPSHHGTSASEASFAVTCPAKGQSVAAGAAGNAAKVTSAVYASLSAGTWKHVAYLRIRHVSGIKESILESVACAKAGRCTAVGVALTKTAFVGLAASAG